MTQSSASLPVIASATTPPTAVICPYLLATDGRWRSSAPAREHRCTAVAPATVVAMDKQRRMCLSTQHDACATFLAAAGGRPVDEDDPTWRPARAVTRPVPRTAPLVLDHGRLPVSMGPIRERGLAQGALLALMVAAFAAIVVARLSGGPPDGGVLAGVGGPGPSPSARATSTAPSAASSLAPTPGPSATADGGRSAEPTASPTAAATPSPRPSTYKVRRGDTLSGIAAEFDTTVRAIAKLNDIDDPARLRVGQELELPPAE